MNRLNPRNRFTSSHCSGGSRIVERAEDCTLEHGTLIGGWGMCPLLHETRKVLKDATISISKLSQI